jgi:hypothetical protein
MVRHLQSNIAAFAGNFTRISVLQTFVTQKISVTSAAVEPTGPVAGSLALTGVGI